MVRAGAGNAQTPKPLELGAQLRCKWREGEVKNCEVIERKLDEDTNEWKYYVHYEGLNRRLDEWVALDRFDLGSVSEEGKMTRTQKRKLDHEEHEEEGELDLATLKEHEEATKVKNINRVVMGRWQMETWYFSPFGKEYDGTDVLYVCEFDLNFFARREQLERYLSTKCRQFHPPGDEVYRETKTIRGEEHHISIYEVDPKDQRIYCENLCLLAKLFLDHKTLFYDVDPFLFYVLCEESDNGDATLAGFFSKEKQSAENNNIACILVLPHHQRKGYGRLLIDLAYNITIREGKLGSPEKPLSDLGQLSFRSYWTEVLLDALRSHKGNLSIKDIAHRTAIQTEDIIATLQSLNLVRFWKGQHVISVSPKIVDEHLRTHAKSSLRCDPNLLTWYLPGPWREADERAHGKK
jgi:histone acetyltransferase MYST1